MKKKLITTICVTLSVIIVIAISYTRGISYAVSREAEGALALHVAYYSWLDNNNIHRLTNSLNIALISQLNTMDAIEKRPLRYGPWYFINSKKSEGDRWELIKNTAKVRVQEQRDELNYLMSNPEEAARRLEQGFEKAFRESGRSNVNVKVTNGRQGSIEMELENWEQQDAQQ